MDTLKKKYTNNTVEEELREIICDQLQEINGLIQENKMLKRLVAEETKAKYEAYKKLASR